jgi:hypothetical protein
LIGVPSLHALAVLWAGAFLGAVAVGAGGFGFALAASSIWLHGLPSVQTTVLVVGCGGLLHALMIWPLRRSFLLGRVWPFVLGCLLGIPLGVRILATLQAATLKPILGGFLVAFGVYAVAGRRLPVIAMGGRGADMVVGLAGGVLGGIGGFSGVLPMIWTQLRGWPRDMARAVYQPYILVANIATLLVVGAFGLDRSGLLLIVAALPALAAGSWVGWQVYGRIDEQAFRRVVACIVAISGLSLVL